MTDATKDVRTPDALPLLDAAEHAWIEERVGRRMTNEEAQLALRDAKLQAAWADWAVGKGKGA